MSVTVDPSSMRVAVLGNVDPAVFWATEMEYVDAWERTGAHVSRYHEKHPEDWDRLIADIKRSRHEGRSFDLIQWTSTKDFRDAAGPARQYEMLLEAKRAEIPVIGVHLDVWIGLARERDIPNDPYFRGVDLLLTADGGHQQEWDEYGVDHHWLLPAISVRWLGIGEPQAKYRSKIAFVGSWQGHYHPESKHRHQLVQWLQDTYGDDVRFYPKANQARIVGRELNDLYASVDVVVGDSCWLPGWTRYLSDRTPETAGRGGVLVHPSIEGVNAVPGDPFFSVTCTWEMGDWDGLRHVIERLLDDPDACQMIREANVELIGESHTYTARCRQIVEIMTEEGLI